MMPSILPEGNENPFVPARHQLLLVPENQFLFTRLCFQLMGLG
jgi:hypothetical protein